MFDVLIWKKNENGRKRCYVTLFQVPFLLILNTLKMYFVSDKGDVVSSDAATVLQVFPTGG